MNFNILYTLFDSEDDDDEVDVIRLLALETLHDVSRPIVNVYWDSVPLLSEAVSSI